MEESQGMWDGFEVISAYTRKQALEDGVLVDLTSLAKEAGFRWPVAVTQGVWSVLEAPEELKVQGQSFAGRAWDMLMILCLSTRQAQGEREVRFAPLFVMRPGVAATRVSMRAVSGPGDEGEPVITVMLDED